MKRCRLLLPLLLCLCLLPACGGAPEAPPDSDAPPDSAVPSLDSDETPFCIPCRIVDGAEDGALLLAALDGALYGGPGDALADGQSVYLLPLTEEIPVFLDGEPASAGDLEDGMPVEIVFDGGIDDSFPAQLGTVCSVSGYSLGSRQNPGGVLYDLCGLYLQVLDDLWQKDPALNEDISMAGLDLSQAPGGLLESEKAALAWRFGQLHGVEVVAGTFQELEEQGYFTSYPISTPAPEEGEDFSRMWTQWEDGCLFSITPNEGHEGELYSLPVVFFNAEKWRTPLAAYYFYGCSAVWPAMGTWSGYQIGGEMIS